MMPSPLDRSWRPTRRYLLGAAAASLAGRATPAAAEESTDRTESFVLTADANKDGEYLYLPFTVPKGVRRVDLELSKSGGDASVGIGLFDHRGPQYQSDGFRGMYGAERRTCYVSASDASRSFFPGPVNPGTWTAFVPVFDLTRPTTISVRVTLTYGRSSESTPAPHQGRSVPVVSSEPGWYGGDLHTHTPESSDAWASGSALSPRGWAERAATTGLDFVSLTDHNVVTQNLQRRRAMRSQGGDVLLLGGEEMTNFFHGHATVTGLEGDQWVDFRQRPRGIPLRDHEARIQQFVRTTRRFGTYTAAAHPMLAINDNEWDFFYEALEDPTARLDGMEVWSGPWTPDDEASLRLWDRLLQAGWRITGSGGSDTHDKDGGDFGLQPGTPTTRVYAESLSTPGIVRGLRQGRVHISVAPDGPELLLEGCADGSTAMIGETLTAPPDATVTFEATVRGGAGHTLFFVRDGEQTAATRIRRDEETVTVTQPMGPGGYLRLELRGRPDIRPDEVKRSRGGMKALTNPIFLSPDGTEPSDPSVRQSATGTDDDPPAIVRDGLVKRPSTETTLHTCHSCGTEH